MDEERKREREREEDGREDDRRGIWRRAKDDSGGEGDSGQEREEERATLTRRSL